MRSLLEHPAFDMKNPNKVYALIGGFASSAVNFHARDGSGYEFLAEQVLKLDKVNAQVASRMVSAFTRWRRYDQDRQSKAKVRRAGTPSRPDSRSVVPRPSREKDPQVTEGQT